MLGSGGGSSGLVLTHFSLLAPCRWAATISKWKEMAEIRPQSELFQNWFFHAQCLPPECLCSHWQRLPWSWWTRWRRRRKLWREETLWWSRSRRQGPRTSRSISSWYLKSKSVLKYFPFPSSSSTPSPHGIWTATLCNKSWWERPKSCKISSCWWWRRDNAILKMGRAEDPNSSLITIWILCSQWIPSLTCWSVTSKMRWIWEAQKSKTFQRATFYAQKSFRTRRAKPFLVKT